MRTHYSFKNALKTCCVMALVALFSTSPALAQTDFGPFTASPNAAVPDNAYTGGLGGMLSSTVNVSGVTGTSVVNIEVDLSMTHTWIGDLIIKLESPDGDILTLVSRPGAAETTDDGIGGTAGSSANLDGAVLTFSDLSVNDAEAMSAGLTLSSEFVCTTNSLCDFYPNPGASAYPTQTFASLFGGNMNGDWTLYIGDHASADVGTLLSWSIRISTVTPSLFAFVGVTVATDGDCTDDALPGTLNSTLNVAPGTGVCYFYYGENTGDVTLNLHDVQDDVFGSVINAVAYPLAPTTSAYVAVGPVTINNTVTNNATWDAYNPGPTDLASGSASATVFIIPDNDLCTGAVPLSCGTPVTGTTAGSSDDDNLTTCSVFADDLGVWYSFEGTGNAIQLSTCGSTSDASGVTPWIAVYEGSCGALTCVTSGSNLDPTCGTNGYVTDEIQTVVGTTYYVFMTAISGFPATIDFDLTLICLPPANDDCADAVALSCGDVVTGSTLTATIDGPATSCPGSSIAADVWYTVSGTGYGITASLCGSGYDTKIEVYTGDCGALVCVGGNDDACGLQSELTWTSTLGETYHIRVHGFSGATGAYTLAITCAPDCNGEAGGIAFIDDCGICAGGSTGIAPGNSVTLDMTDSFDDGWNGATYVIADNSDPLNPVTITSGDLDNATGDGTGVGQDILCLPDGCYLITVGGGSFDDEIGWTLTGVDGGPIIGGAPESVAFSINTASCPVAGCTDPASLNYDAAATVDDGSCIYPPANDDCADAITIDCSDSGLAGTSINSTVDADYTNCGAGGDNTTQRGVWYKVIGDNQQYTITTCDASGTGYDTRLTVFSGSCGSFTCVTANDDMSPVCGTGSFRSEVTFNANAGTDYYVFVHGFQSGVNLSATGDFILNISCTELCLPVPSNDDCASASSLSVSGTCSPVTGTTQCATAASSNPACFSQFATLADVWYSFVAPADGEATMNITNVSAVGTGYAVYDACGGAGVDCDAAYVSGTDVAWTGLTAGATYYIQVMTNGAVNAGDFTICVSGNVPTCDATAGTLTADASPVTLEGGSAVISATEGTAPFVPAGYSVLYVLTEGAGLVIIDAAATPSFTVTAAGDYTIHTLVYDPNTLDISSVVFGTTTGFDVNGLLIQGGGSICGALDVTGAPIVVDEVVGISESLDRSLSVYPNPNNGQFIVELNGAEGVGTLNIMDMMGRRVYTAGVNFNGSFRQSIDLNVAKGTYVLQVITENGIATRKVELH